MSNSTFFDRAEPGYDACPWCGKEMVFYKSYRYNKEVWGCPDCDDYDDYICCGEQMIPTGLDLGNGWKCRKCGKQKYDVASVKMSGNYEAYLSSPIS